MISDEFLWVWKFTTIGMKLGLLFFRCQMEEFVRGILETCSPAEFCKVFEVMLFQIPAGTELFEVRHDSVVFLDGMQLLLTNLFYRVFRMEFNHMFSVDVLAVAVGRNRKGMWLVREY